MNDGKEWEFNLDNSGNNRTMKVFGPGGFPWEDTENFSNLKEKLHNKGIQFDDINKEPSLTYGFTDIISGKYDNIDLII